MTPSKTDQVDDGPVEEELPVVNWLTLRLLSSTKGKPTDLPQIILTKEDAHSLDILNDD